MSLGVIALWMLIALLFGCFFATTGIATIYAMIALAALIIFTAVAARFPEPVMIAAIWMLGLVPFNWGLATGVIPKVFGDEVFLLLYLMVFPFLYLFTNRKWQSGYTSLYLILTVFVCGQAFPFVSVEKDLVASRNFLETFALGAIFLVLFLQESANCDTEMISKSVVWLTVAIAVLSVLERIVQRNVVMENQTDIVYLSSTIVKATEGVYRPYVDFFHPSEAGTFMGLGVPFALREWNQRRSLISTLALITIGAGLAVNATRGVWLGVAIALLFLIRNAWKFLAASVPVAALVGAGGYLALKNTPFMDRLTDPNNLLSRFEFWKLTLQIYADHPFIGVGHMQFKNFYLDYVQDLSNSAHFDIGKISVVDNIYLTNLAEHGSLGIITLIGVLIFFFTLMARLRRQLTAAGLIRGETFLHASSLSLVIYCAAGCFADVNQFTKATKFVFILIGIGLGTASRSHRLQSAASIEDVAISTPSSLTA